MPKVLVPAVLPGLLNCGVLKRLKNSHATGAPSILKWLCS